MVQTLLGLHSKDADFIFFKQSGKVLLLNLSALSRHLYTTDLAYIIFRLNVGIKTFPCERCCILSYLDPSRYLHTQVLIHIFFSVIEAPRMLTYTFTSPMRTF